MKKHLIIKQHDLTDCGPACLLSILVYYGGYVPIEMLRSGSYTDKTGTSAYNLICCARKYGLYGTGIKLDSIETLKCSDLPCIAHLKLKNGLNHFVVIYKINNKDLTIMDPAKGKIKINLNEFKKIFSKVIILLRPYKKIEKINKPNSVKNILINSVIDNKGKTILLILLSTFLIIISLFLNYFLKVGNEIVSNDFSEKTLLIFSTGYFVLYVIKNLFAYIKNRLIIIFNKNVCLKLFGDFSKNIFNLPLSFIKSRTSGEIISRFNELSEVNNLLPNIILSIFFDLIMASITVIFLIFISLKLTIIALIFMILYLIVSYAFKNPTLHKINNNLDKNADFNSAVIESVNNLRSIKNLNNDANMKKRMDKYRDEAIYDNYNLDCFYSILSFIKSIIYDFMIVFLSSFGLYLISKNKLNIVDLFTFLMVISYYTEPVKDLVDMVTKFCFIKNSINKINEFSINQDCNVSKRLFKSGDIEISHLSYAYNGIDYVINNYSCLIRNKSKVLIQGTSGSGKSTLCQIISKQLTNYEGNIYINKENIRDLNDNSIRQNITYIGQKDSLIIDTIKNNIKYERNVDNKEFNTICKICEIDEIVDRKFNHFDSIICESSDNISGGEKQRITLARGLINSGSILILDESLSEVNKDMEERILRRIFDYFKEKTIIYVSHKNYNGIFDKTINI